MRKLYLALLFLITFSGCSTFMENWNDTETRLRAMEQGQRARDFATAVTGYSVAGTAFGGLVAMSILLKKKKKEGDK